jgi:uncharacterized protein YegJ (DUF2314 family)
LHRPRSDRALLAGLFAISVFLLSAISACSWQSPQTKARITPGPQMTDYIHFQFAVYLLPDSPKNSIDIAHQLLSQKYPSLKLSEDVPKNPASPSVHIRDEKNVQKSYAPPDLKMLQYSGHGLTPDQQQLLQRSREAIILDFAHPRANVWTALYSANSLLHDLARQTNGIAWDDTTREAFSPDAWHTRRLDAWTGSAAIPAIQTQTTIHVYPFGDMLRAITLGMSKFGLPDVVIENVSHNSDDQVGVLINLFCQALAENPSLDSSGRFKLALSSIKKFDVTDAQKTSLKANAIGEAMLTLTPGKPDEGDPDNRLIQINADAYSGNDLTSRQQHMLSCFFGSSDSVHSVSHTDELLAASQKAKEHLPQLREQFNSGLQPGETILLKAPFPPTGTEHEWMWVEVTRWKDGKIQGILDDDPVYATNLKAGQRVEVREEDIFDYIHHFPDDHNEGNTTGEIISKMDQETTPPTAPTPDCATNNR